MSKQKYFECYHRAIKVETDELREKRDILVDKVRTSLKSEGHPLPNLLNQGSYIYGVGVIPIGDVEYDIDVGLDFPILSSQHDASDVRQWVLNAVEDHTHNVEDRGPCIRVRYVAGYHVDLVVYSRFRHNDSYDDYQLARRDGTWHPAEPKKLKEFIANARKPFTGTKDASGADQLQRITRYLKRWNDIDTPDESSEKPFGLATMLLVIEHLKSPCLDFGGEPNDLEALIKIITAVELTSGRIIIKKPTQEFEDVFARISAEGMDRLKMRFRSLLSDLKAAKAEADNEKAAKILRKQFGDDFPEATSFREVDSLVSRENRIADARAAIPSFNNPARPWCKI